MVEVSKEISDTLEAVTKELEEESRQKLIQYHDSSKAELVRKGQLILNNLPQAEAEKLMKTYYDRSWDEIVLKFEPQLGPKMKVIADKFINDP